MCFSSKYNSITNYRLDRMEDVQLEKELVIAGSIIDDSDTAEYTSQAFKMYGGSVIDTTLEFYDKLLSVVEDKFGEDVKLVRTGSDKPSFLRMGFLVRKADDDFVPSVIGETI